LTKISAAELPRAANIVSSELTLVAWQQWRVVDDRQLSGGKNGPPDSKVNNEDKDPIMTDIRESRSSNRFSIGGVASVISRAARVIERIGLAMAGPHYEDLPANWTVVVVVGCWWLSGVVMQIVAGIAARARKHP
jgi:hypothetical protein